MNRPTSKVLAPSLLVAVLLVGCGDDVEVDPSPLEIRLAQVDRSLVDRRFVQARADLAGLAADTRAARDAGDVSAVQADAILDAIVALRAVLPTPTPTPTTTPTPTPTPTPGSIQKADPSDGAEKSKGRGKGKGRS